MAGFPRSLMKVLRLTLSLLYRHKIQLLCLLLLSAFVSQVLQASINLNPLDGIDYKLFFRCQEVNNEILAEATEINKVVGAAATTLMTLLPALLVFGPFPTAEIRAMLPYSTGAALITAGFTLGLATSNIVTVGKNRILSVADLCSEATIHLYGAHGATRSGIAELYMATMRSADGGNVVQDLITPVLDAITPEHDIRHMRDIMMNALLSRSRAKRIDTALLSLVFMLVQGCLIIMLLGFAPDLLRINIVWICYNTPLTKIVLVTWIGGMIVLAGLIRTFADSSIITGEEVLHLSPVTPATVVGNCEYCSLAAAPPPMPVSGLTKYAGLMLRQTLAELHLSMRTRRSVSRALRHLISVQNIRHPMVLILRPVADDGYLAPRATTLFYAVICGFVQALFLIGLTILFGSTFDSGIIQAAIFVVFFIAAIVSSRTYSIYFCLWMQGALGTTIIEFASVTELRAMKAVLCGMPFVVVANTTDGSVYSGGYRLDLNAACRGAHLTPRLWLPARCFGVLAGVVFGAPLVYGTVRVLDYGRVDGRLLDTLYMLCFALGIAFGAACVVVKVVAELAFVDVHCAEVEDGAVVEEQTRDHEM